MTDKTNVQNAQNVQIPVKQTGLSLNQPVNEPAPTISVGDLRNLIAIVDFAADNGVFRGWKTITEVQALRTKVVSFLDHIAPLEQPKVDDKKASTMKAKKK